MTVMTMTGRERHTFTSRPAMSVGNSLVYGPRSAAAYATVRTRHLAILADRETARNKMAFVYPILGNVAAGNRFIKATFPDEWAALTPWQRLSREGYQEILDAAIADTEALDDDGEDMMVFPTPREAYDFYRPQA